MAGARIRSGEIVLATGRHPYRLRRSRKAKRLFLKVEWPNRIEVVVPYWSSYRHAEVFLHRHTTWLNRVVQRNHVLRARVPQRQWVSGEGLPLLGETIHLHVTRTESSRGRYRWQHPVLHVTVPTSHHVQAAVERWYRLYARTYFTRQVTTLASQLAVSVAGVRIGNPKTQWGSCGATGKLSFNWRLMLAPAMVANYVAVHEVAHLKHRNHSPRFWQTVGQLMPEYELARRWLKQHGRTLRLD